MGMLFSYTRYWNPTDGTKDLQKLGLLWLKKISSMSPCLDRSLCTGPCALDLRGIKWLCPPLLEENKDHVTSNWSHILPTVSTCACRTSKYHVWANIGQELWLWILSIRILTMTSSQHSFQKNWFLLHLPTHKHKMATRKVQWFHPTL